MAYIGKTPTAAPLTSSDVTDGIISTAKIADGIEVVDWQSVVTASTLTAVAGRGYPINTTSNACTVTLPASASVGETIKFVDYARNWGTNALTINPNSLNFQGASSPNPEYDTNMQSVTITYVDATQGWIPTVDDAVTYETSQAYTVDFLVVAGGGGGGYDRGGGGGAGGYRNSYNSETSGGNSSSETALELITGTVYTITVGGGGAGATSTASEGADGVASSIAGSDITDITSTGGGGGGTGSGSVRNGQAGGSGGGGAYNSGTAGAGTSGQGMAGGAYGSSTTAAGGGGASEVGTGASDYGGGNGLSSSITGSAVTRGGGGGGHDGGDSAPPGGTGGGGAGGQDSTSNGMDATANTGGGGGSGRGDGVANGGDGGSGVVILRLPTASYSSTTTGTPTVSTDGSDTILLFNASGSYTA